MANGGQQPGPSSEDSIHTVLEYMHGVVITMDEVRSTQEKMFDRQRDHGEHLAAMDERTAKLAEDVKRGHECRQESRIASVEATVGKLADEVKIDIHHGIRQAERLESQGDAIDQIAERTTQLIEATTERINTVNEEVNKRIDRASTKSKALWSLALGSAVTIVLALIAAAVGIGRFQGNYEASQLLNTERHNALTKSFETANKDLLGRHERSNKRIADELVKLSNRVEESNGHERRFNDRCKGWPRSKKARHRLYLQREGLSVPTSCMQ